MMKSKAGYIQIDNASLYYESAGAGHAMVFIHAGVADSRQWNSEFAVFSKLFHVVRYDQRGFGKSRPAEGDFSHLRDLEKVLDMVCKTRPATLVGCSMGGHLAMDYALENPENVDALVMVGAGPSGLSLDIPDHPLMAKAEKAYDEGRLEDTAEIETQIWFDGMGRTADQVDNEMRRLAREMDILVLEHERLGLGNQLPNTGKPAVSRISELSVPVLAIVGEHDIPYSHAAADYVVEHVSGARKIIIDDAAHLPNMEHPAIFQRAVLDFLKDAAVYDDSNDSVS